MIYLQLFWVFFKTGLFAIGGGLATLPFLSEMGRNFEWFTDADLANMLAVSESTPGPIGVNMATYVGNVVGAQVSGSLFVGLLSGVVATISLILPSYLIILIVYKIMAKFSENRFVRSAMSSLRPASVGMVSAAVLGILQSVFLATGAITPNVLHELLIPNLVLFLIIFLFYQKFQKIHPVVFLLVGAVAGIIFKL